MDNTSISERILGRFGFRSEKAFRRDLQEAVKLELDDRYRWLSETADAQYWDIDPDSESPAYFNQSDYYRISPLVGTALDVLGNDVGLSNFNVFELDGENETALPNHEFELLMRDPNELDSGMDFMRDSGIGYKINGNYVWWLNRASKEEPPAEMWPIPYEMIKPVPDKRLYISHYNYFSGMGKTPEPLPTWQILHFKNYNPHNRFVGISLIESLAMTLEGNQGMRKTKRDTYTKYNGSPPSILSFDDWIPDETWRDVKIEKKNAAMRNDMMMIRGAKGGVSWMSRAVNAKDAEFIANLKADMETTFNRMTPGLLAMLAENANRATAEAARATYAEKAQWPLLETFAQKISKNPLPVYASEGKKLIGHFDDPRVVDRELKLQEQKEYAKTHTVDQVNQEYYGEDPLGDERGSLLVSEIRTAPSSIPVERETAPAPGGNDLSAKAAIDELMTWRTVALRGKAVKAQNFLCAYVPKELALSIKSELPSANDKDTIAAIFDRAADGLRPKTQIDPAILLQGLEAGVRALEAMR